MYKPFAQPHFVADENGDYYAPGCNFAVRDELHEYYEACKASGEETGNPLGCLVLLALDEEGGIATDAGSFTTWADVLAVLNRYALEDAYNTAAAAVYDTPSTNPTQLAADNATFTSLRRQLDEQTSLSQFTAPASNL